MLPGLGRMFFLLVLVIATKALPQPSADAASNYAGVLVKAYPAFLDRVEGNKLVWKDGTHMRFDDGKDQKFLELLRDEPDIKDMFVMKYFLGEKGIPPEINSDPGRVRYLPLFRKMYGDCRTDDFMANGVTVRWLPTKNGKTLKFTKINGASTELQKVSDELDKLPDRFLQYLWPTQGTYNCRSVAKPSDRVLTASALLSISLPRILSIGYGPNPIPMGAFPIKTKFLGKSFMFSSSTGSFGAVNGITTIQCTLNIGLRLLRLQIEV